MTEVTRWIGETIGKPDLTYRQLTADQVRSGMLSTGLPSKFVDLYLEMLAAFRDGRVQPTQELGPDYPLPGSRRVRLSFSNASKVLGQSPFSSRESPLSARSLPCV